MQNKRNKRNGQNSSQQMMAAEILQNLFEASSSNRRNAPNRQRGMQSMRAEYTCKSCHTTNWEDRKHCRACGSSRVANSQQKGQGQPTPPATQGSQQTLPQTPPRTPGSSSTGKSAGTSPAATAATIAQRQKALEAALQAATDQGGDESVLKEITDMIGEKPTPPKPKSAASELTATQGFVTRQSRRLQEVDEEIARLQEQRTTMKVELDEAKTKETSLLQQISKESRMTQGVAQTLATLCTDLASLQVLTTRKKPRKEDDPPSTAVDTQDEQMSQGQEAQHQPEEIKVMMIKLVELGAKLQAALHVEEPNAQPATRAASDTSH